ncbi:unnamed protein product [Aphanomyces euteiches]|uniref:Ryanodine receptor Ryr domain-containing protein n=1 Tax=Aphanomyces euteiches TaxID=100861 RepID=A0A6G0WK34_9STRA|nr:hypothetical protein Ae201684_014433 [Aphanomyces euteiches]KAH9101627.1 hypothetical protein AeMF1_021626 [Aphanomyces euteiches]KAH9158153.1 hypothetical protein AeRB84_000094 [Aphanomyces euteiches]KAH9191969.1 hypothetical protein AeNC1_006054 [Aphanomyces euteiches]
MTDVMEANREVPTQDESHALYAIQNYVPKPIDTSGIELSAEVAALGELMAEHCHDVWAVERIKKGWTWGPTLDDSKLQHPNLVPFKALSPSEQSFDFQTASEVIKVVLSLHYTIVRDRQTAHTSARVFVESSWSVVYGAVGETYVPRPLNTANIVLPTELSRLQDLLAENTHEVWSKGRFEAGWVYGPQRNNPLKTHPCLVPYWLLVDDEKAYDIELAREMLKILLACGYKILAPTNPRSSVRD